MNTPKIFGREPVVIVNGIEGVLACLIAFHALAFIGLNSPDDLGIVMAVVSSALGVYVAYATKDTLLGALTGFLKAGVALAAVYGWQLSEQQTATVIVAMTAILAMWHRTQTGPAIAQSFDLVQHSMSIPPGGEATWTRPVVSDSTGALTVKAVSDKKPE